MSKKDNKFWVDMCAGSELRDSQGESLSVEGANIDELDSGAGRLNDNHGKGFFNSLGRVVEAKKIFKAEDCTEDRHKYYWDKIKAPYIYAKGYLYADKDHTNASACAAILRNIHKSDASLKIKASVEGGVVARGVKDSSVLARTNIHSIALTFTPANNATLVEPLGLEKTDLDNDIDTELIKSVMHLAQDDVPSFRKIERTASAQKILNNLSKIEDLAKNAGLEISIEEASVDELVRKAISSKILDNMKEINKLVKVAAYKQPAPPKQPEAIDEKPAVNDMNYLPQKVSDHRKDVLRDKKDVYQKDITKLKGDPMTPAAPGKSGEPGGSTPLISGQEHKSVLTFKRHAARAMKDPKYLDSLRDGLTQKGIKEGKIEKMLAGIQEHITTDDVEKSAKDIGNMVRNIALTAALAAGAHHFSPDKDAKAETPKKIVNVLPNKKEVGRAYLGRIKPIKKPKEEVEKALTAGYGGAGAPTSVTGGGVMQSESVDKKFKYVTCTDCGKEQVYMGNQIRCRECGKGFSMKKIFEFIT